MSENRLWNAKKKKGNPEKRNKLTSYISGLIAYAPPVHLVFQGLTNDDVQNTISAL